MSVKIEDLKRSIDLVELFGSYEEKKGSFRIIRYY
jgi:hypothetical protein